MPKYYVQCGHLEMILSSDSSAQAAFSALDRTLQNHLWIYDDPDLSEQDQRDHVVLEALLHLDPGIRVSERGFDRKDATLIETPEVIFQWHELMVGIKRLLVAAGLASRSMTTEIPLEKSVDQIDGEIRETKDRVDPRRKPR